MLHCILWIFQNFITVSKIFLKGWNFAHLLVTPKTTTTPKIRRFYWNPEEKFYFLCFLSFGCHGPKNRRKISNKKWILCKCVLLIYIWEIFFLQKKDFLVFLLISTTKITHKKNSFICMLVRHIYTKFIFCWRFSACF